MILGNSGPERHLGGNLFPRMWARKDRGAVHIGGVMAESKRGGLMAVPRGLCRREVSWTGSKSGRGADDPVEL